MTAQNSNNESRDRLAYYYSQLTDETLQWRLMEGGLAEPEQEIVRAELARRAVSLTPVPPANSAQATAQISPAPRGRTLRRLSAVFLLAVTAVSGMVAYGLHRMITGRHPHVLKPELTEVLGATTLRVIVASVAAYVIAVIITNTVRARWTWVQVTVCYLGMLLASVLALLPGGWKRIGLYLE